MSVNILTILADFAKIRVLGVPAQHIVKEKYFPEFYARQNRGETYKRTLKRPKLLMLRLERGR